MGISGVSLWSGISMYHIHHTVDIEIQEIKKLHSLLSILPSRLGNALSTLGYYAEMTTKRSRMGMKKKTTDLVNVTSNLKTQVLKKTLQMHHVGKDQGMTGGRRCLLTVNNYILHWYINYFY